jgi:hypothetical protein
MPTNLSFIAATHADLAGADGDYAEVRRRYEQRDILGEFDGVTIGRKATGEHRFHLGHTGGRGTDGTLNTSWSLAAALGAALFPSVAADVPRGRSAQCAILGSIAGEVARVLGRGRLMTFGEHLDRSPAVLIVVTDGHDEEWVVSSLSHSTSVLTDAASVDIDHLQQLVARATFRQP